MIGARNAANAEFYGRDVTPRDILVEGRVTVPADKVTLLPEVYAKLAKCEAAATAEPTPAEEEKKSLAASAAEQASASVRAKEGSNVIQVDAAAEAVKEAA